MTAEFKVEVPRMDIQAGKRLLLPVGVFSDSEKGLFEHANECMRIYFEFPFQKIDDLSFKLPEGITVGNLPPARNRSGGAVIYELRVENKDGVLHISRLYEMAS